MLNSIIHTWWHFIMPFVQYWLLHGMQTTANTPSTKHTHTHTRICIRKKNNIHTNLIKPLVSKFKCIQNISPFLHSLCVYLRVCLPFVWVWSGFFRSFFFVVDRIPLKSTEQKLKTMTTPTAAAVATTTIVYKEDLFKIPHNMRYPNLVPVSSNSSFFCSNTITICSYLLFFHPFFPYGKHKLVAFLSSTSFLTMHNQTYIWSTYNNAIANSNDFFKKKTYLQHTQECTCLLT